VVVPPSLLRQVVLSNNNISVLPATMLRATNVRSLDLENCNLTSVPTDITGVEHVGVLVDWRISYTKHPYKVLHTREVGWY